MITFTIDFATVRSIAKCAGLTVNELAEADAKLLQQRPDSYNQLKV